MSEEAAAPLDGRTIAKNIYMHRNDLPRLSFWAGMACGRLQQYQEALEAAGLPLPEGDDGMGPRHG